MTRPSIFMEVRWKTLIIIVKQAPNSMCTVHTLLSTYEAAVELSHRLLKVEKGGSGGRRRPAQLEEPSFYVLKIHTHTHSFTQCSASLCIDKSNPAPLITALHYLDYSTWGR